MIVYNLFPLYLDNGFTKNSLKLKLLDWHQKHSKHKKKSII